LNNIGTLKGGQQLDAGSRRIPSQAKNTRHSRWRRDLVIELANDASLYYFGKSAYIMGKPLVDALPEMMDQGYPELLLQLMDTGTPQYLSDVPVTFLVNEKKILRYYNAVQGECCQR
jgi:hypothetical protein